MTFPKSLGSICPKLYLSKPRGFVFLVAMVSGRWGCGGEVSVGGRPGLTSLVYGEVGWEEGGGEGGWRREKNVWVGFGRLVEGGGWLVGVGGSPTWWSVVWADVGWREMEVEVAVARGLAKG